MCQECHIRYHTGEDGYNHVTQNLFPDPWTLDGPDQAYPTEAVIRLLGEAQPNQKARNDAMGWVMLWHKCKYMQFIRKTLKGLNPGVI